MYNTRHIHVKHLTMGIVAGVCGDIFTDFSDTKLQKLIFAKDFLRTTYMDTLESSPLWDWHENNHGLLTGNLDLLEEAT